MQEQTEILKHFDDIFKTDTLKHINLEDMKLLKAIYTYLEEDLYTPNSRYKELRAQAIKISDKLEETFTNEQQKLFESYWEVESLMNCEENEQMFLFGGIIARKLEQEMKIQNKNE